MAEVTSTQQTTSSLFIGLQSYTESQASIFFGRDEEIDRLTNLVKTNTLTIVFGKSGTGKTSLLNAGVFPRLRKDYCLPFRIRLDFGDDSPDLVSQVKTVLKTEIDTYGFRVESYPAEETLWEYFHREPLWKSVTPILIFDQFEEVFTLGKKKEAVTRKNIAAFWEELADLIENSIPEKLKEQFLAEKESIGFSYKTQHAKIVFTFREEFLPEFENITTKIPSIKYSRFRLMPMDGEQAYQVVTKTWGTSIDAAQAHKVVSFFASEEEEKKAYEQMEIEPSLLSQVCSFIDKERIHEGKTKISDEFLDKYPKEKILRAVYNEALQESNKAVLAKQASTMLGQRPMNEFLEDNLITDEGYRIKYSLTEHDDKLLPGVSVLTAKYFIREDEKSVELTHDVLTPLIKSDREERRKKLAMALAKKKANRRALYIVMISVVAAGTLWYFTTDSAVKAIQERDVALRDKEHLDSLLRSDSAALKVLESSLEKTKEKLDQLKKAGRGLDDASIMERLQNDSLELEAKQGQIIDLVRQRSALEENIGTYKAEIGNLFKQQDSLQVVIRKVSREMASMQRKIAYDSSTMARMQKNYNDLVKSYDNYIYQVSNPVTDDEDDVFDTGTDNVSLDLYYSGTPATDIKIPGNLKIYLFPDSAVNKRIIRDAKAYEINCNESALDAARGKKIARYRNGKYMFYNVPPGKYFVKICTYYGGYYTFTKKSGNDSVRWEISPPIR